MIYPPRCPVCDGARPVKAPPICPECYRRLVPVGDIYCLKCGKPLGDDSQMLCEDCTKWEHSYIEGRAVFVYNDAMRRSVYRLKYNGRREYATVYGTIMGEVLAKKIAEWNADAIIPVPAHKARQKKRGYNQAKLIANAVSKVVKVPVKDGIVTRSKSTTVQKNLSATDRRNNLKNAFKIGGDVVKLNSVIIVDDIYTTGSTIDGVTDCLHRAGVRDVYYIALSIGTGI